jgi:hypothetical protein
MAKKKATKDAAGKFKKRMDGLMGEYNWRVTINGNSNIATATVKMQGKKAEVIFGDDAPVWGTELYTISVPLLVIPEWCACENRDAEVDGYCADCGGKIRQS